MTSFLCGSPGIHFILMDSVFFVGFPFAEVLLNRRNSPGAEWVRGFRALSDFRVRGTREAGERWWGLAGPQQCSGGKGGRLLSDTWGVRGRARKRGAGGGGA